MKKQQYAQERGGPLTNPSRNTRSHDKNSVDPMDLQDTEEETSTHLSHDQRVRIHTLYHIAKWSVPQISKVMGCSRKAVYYWIERETFDDLPKSGRPHEYDHQHFIELQRSHQEWSLKDMREHWSNDPTKSIPALSTLHDMSKNLPFRTVSGKAVHKFTSQQLNDRVEAAKEHQGPRKKHHTWFLDETNIGSQAHVQRLRVFEEDLPNYQLLDKIKGFSGHFFGAISYHGKSELFSYDRKLDGKDYQLLIENYVIPPADKYYGWSKDGTTRLWELCADNDGAHVSHDTKEYLSTRGVRIWWFPSWSPDMNPIEFIWSLLWHDVAKRKPTTNTEVIQYAKEFWRDLPQKTIQNIIDNLDEVYQYIIDNNGEIYKHGQ
jgi:transposase